MIAKKDYIFNCFIGYQVLEKNDFNCIDYLQEIFDKYDLGIDIRAFDKKGKKFFIQYVVRENGTVYHKEYKLSKIELEIYNLLKEKPQSSDELAKIKKMNISKINEILSVLELEDFIIKKVNNKYAVKLDE